MEPHGTTAGTAAVVQVLVVVVEHHARVQSCSKLARHGRVLAERAHFDKIFPFQRISGNICCLNVAFDQDIPNAMANPAPTMLLQPLLRLLSKAQRSGSLTGRTAVAGLSGSLRSLIRARKELMEGNDASQAQSVQRDLLVCLPLNPAFSALSQAAAAAASHKQGLIAENGTLGAPPVSEFQEYSGSVHILPSCRLPVEVKIWGTEQKNTASGMAPSSNDIKPASQCDGLQASTAADFAAAGREVPWTQVLGEEEEVEEEGVSELQLLSMSASSMSLDSIAEQPSCSSYSFGVTADPQVPTRAAGAAPPSSFSLLCERGHSMMGTAGTSMMKGTATAGQIGSVGPASSFPGLVPGALSASESSSWPASSGSPSLAVGSVCLHKEHLYPCVIIGRDSSCSAPRAWQEAASAQLSTLQQPFYTFLAMLPVTVPVASHSGSDSRVSEVRDSQTSSQIVPTLRYLPHDSLLPACSLEEQLQELKDQAVQRKEEAVQDTSSSACTNTSSTGRETGKEGKALGGGGGKASMSTQWMSTGNWAETWPFQGYFQEHSGWQGQPRTSQHSEPSKSSSGSGTSPAVAAAGTAPAPPPNKSLKQETVLQPLPWHWLLQHPLLPHFFSACNLAGPVFRPNASLQALYPLDALHIGLQEAALASQGLLRAAQLEGHKREESSSSSSETSRKRHTGLPGQESTAAAGPLPLPALPPCQWPIISIPAPSAAGAGAWAWERSKRGEEQSDSDCDSGSDDD